MVIDGPEEFSSVLESYAEYLPCLESAIEGVDISTRRNRFERNGYFIPKELGGDKRPTQVNSLGRHFSDYECLANRRRWHELTEQIHSNKESEVFPDSWVESIVDFIDTDYHLFPTFQKVLLTVIPARPGRVPRLAKLLEQIGEFVAGTKFENGLIFAPDLLAYKAGVVSNSREHLSRVQRFANIRDHLYVANPKVLTARSNVLVLDDVVTSGSTLIYAKKYIEQVVNCDVKCLAVAKNIGKIIG
ncbi:hypothetical protein D9M68_684280 [compost metagenome]